MTKVLRMVSLTSVGTNAWSFLLSFRTTTALELDSAPLGRSDLWLESTLIQDEPVQMGGYEIVGFTTLPINMMSSLLLE